MSASTILLVDDDEVLRQVLRRVLVRQGHHVVEAGTVAEALECARAQRPALAIIDLRLPDGDGVELAQQLVQQVGPVPLILLTAYPLRLRDEPDLARSFKQVLTKPLNLDEIRRAVDSTLVAIPSAAETPRETNVATPPTTAAAAPMAASPSPSAPKPPRRWRWILGTAVVLVGVGLVVAVPALGTPALERFFNLAAPPMAAPVLQSHARLLPGPEELELPRDVAERLGVMSEPVQTDIAPRTLQLAGSLAFDPNRLGRVQARFAGEVVALGTPGGHLSSEYPQERVLRYGDSVTEGQLLAVVLSKELGEKKSELVDTLVRLWYDEAQLTKLEELGKQGIVPAVTVMNQRTIVNSDRNALFRVRRTLRTWRVPEDKIAAVEKEARRVSREPGDRDLDKESEWAKVEVRAPFDGTIVEKNVSLHSIVSTDFDLFKVADLGKLGVVVHAYEEDLRVLRQLPRGFPWKVRAAADPNAPPLKSDGLQQLGLVVDPTQHTEPVMGLVSNEGGHLRVGQFVKATIDLPAPPNVVSVPSSTVVEDGDVSTVFLQPDPAKPHYARRRVAVAMRLRDTVYIRSDLSEQDRKKGLQAIKPGEFIVTEGVLELQSALEELQARAKAHK